MAGRHSVTQARTAAPLSRLAAFSALRHPSYRRYWIGMVISIGGLNVQFVALSWLVYDLTGSPVYLGLVGLSQAVPTIALSLFGGVIADRVDRLRLLMVTQSVTAFTSFALGTLALTDTIAVWHILTLSFISGAVAAFDQPTRLALVPRLVPQEELTSAVALGSMVWQIGRIAGPAVGGLLTAVIGSAPCFFITSAGFAVMVFALSGIHVIGQETPQERKSVLRELGEGITYVLRERVFAALIGMTFLNSIFGMSYVTLMPVFARDILAVGSSGYGLLMGISGGGALAGNFLIASLGPGPRKGWLVTIVSGLFGSLLVLLALSAWFPLSLGAMLAVGATNAVYMTLINTTLQTLVPDSLRGRVMGIYSLTWSLMPLGGMLSSGIASIWNAQTAVAVGGLAVAALAMMVAAAVPQVRSLR